MKAHVQPHRAAMAAVDEAERAKRTNDDRARRAALRHALVLETRAAEAVGIDLEPTRSILFRSAASIAVELGDTIEARRLAVAGLQGNAPQEIMKEIVELLADLIPARRKPDAKTLTQQLRIKARGAADLTGSVITEIPRLWFQAFKSFAGWNMQPVFRDASFGSYVVRFEIRGKEKHQAQVQPVLKELRDFASMLEDPRPSGDDPKQDADRLRQGRSLLDLVSALTEADLVLEITTRVGTEDPESFELRPATRNQLEEWQKEAAGRILSADVPQADDLERVVRFVCLLSRGRYPTPATLDVTPRQVNYYRRAAEILGYLRNRVLTPSGRLLVRLTGGDSWQHVVENLTTSDVGSAWIEWSGKANVLDIDPGTAEAFLEERAVGLSPATTKRRAKTLSSWHSKLAEETE